MYFFLLSVIMWTIFYYFKAIIMTKNINDLSFEEALQQLETIVAKLETGEVPLEQAIAYYEQGAKLKTHCEQTLKSAVHKIETIQFDGNGNAQTTRLDDDSKNTESEGFPF